MIRFRDLPIRRKVTFLILATSTTVLVLVGAAFMGYEWITFRKAALTQLTTIVSIVAENSTAALRFRSEKDAGDLLASLKAEPSVTFAGLYDEKGRLFAGYPKLNTKLALLGEIPAEGHRFGPYHLWVYAGVIQDGQRYGTLVVQSNLAAAYRRFALYGGMVLFVLVASSLAAFVVSARLQTRIAAPIQELARIAQAIAVNRDFTMRAARYGNDELGALTDSFNHMLSEIREAQHEIQRLNGDLERRVDLRTKELYQTNSELEAFTYSVSHDLRAPLWHVSSYAEAIKDDAGSALSPDAVGYLGRIQYASVRLSGLVDGLLRLSRVGRQALIWTPTNLGQVVEQVRRELEKETRGRDIEWEQQDLPMVSCDATLIALVFTNLLSNALKYTRPRSPARIAIGSVLEPDGYTFFVRDNGVGFDPAYQNRLFGVFERLHSVAEFEGHGVGLATAQRIIRNHGGRIWAEGRLNEGATFFFTIAAAPVQPSPRTN